MVDENRFDTESTQAQMRKGLLEFCILLVIAKDPIYAGDILKKLKQADLIVVEGTVYPLLSRLKNSGLLNYTWEESPSGPPRKYYNLTEKGRHTLKTLTAVWHDLNKSINSLKK